MTKYVRLTDSFEACRLDPATFAHADHVGVAYEMLQRYSFIDATTRYLAGIQALVTAADATDKFNITITVAFMSIIAERMATTTHLDFDEFCRCNPDLASSAPLSAFYSPQRLQSALAKHQFLMPDIRG